jgi:mediator of RNA polymerase II transcription subunit 8
MQREEKQLELSIDALVTRLHELKNQLQALLFKIEQESSTLTWPTVLDNFALISAQFTAVLKALSTDKTPPLRNLTVLPLLLSQDRDKELFQLTERRIPAFSHDLVPDYLRTKPEPDIEVKIHQFLNKANGIAFDTAQKQITAFNKVLTHVLEIVNKSKEEWESEAGSRNGIGQTSLQQDTHALVAAVSTGKGLKQIIPQGVAAGPGMLVPPGVRAGGPGPAGAGPTGPQSGSIVTNPAQVNMLGKAPSGIKTNIRPASQLHSFR